MIETMGSSLLVVLTFHEQKTKGFNPVKGSKVGNVLHAEKLTEDGETLSSSLAFHSLDFSREYGCQNLSRYVLITNTWQVALS